MPPLYFRYMGLVVFSAWNAPFFIFKMHVPFVVAPSAKIRNGAYYPVYSISSWRSLMVSSAKALFSGDPPLGIKMLSITSQSVPMSGTLLNSSLGAKAGLIL